MLNAYPPAFSGGGGGYDPDAAAFFAAAGITDSTEKTAVNQLVLDLKAASLWTKFFALYPFVGGTSGTESYNLANPSTYQISWSGSLTFNGNGVTSGGGTGDTGIANNSLNNNGAFGFYDRTATSEGQMQMGVTNLLQLLAYYPGLGIISDNTFAGSGSRIIAANSSAQGLFASTRTSSALHEVFKNGSSQGTNSSASAGFSGTSIKIFDGGSAHNLALAFASTGISSGNAASFYTAVQAFQTTLGRQV